MNVPDSVVQGLRLPDSEAEARLRTELALALYAQRILSFGKAAELAQTARFRFAELAAQHGIQRHCTEEDLAADLSYARGE